LGEWAGLGLLLADAPPAAVRSADASPAGRHEALVTLARAVFAVGGRIALPADAGVSMLIATAGLEYAPVRVAERRQAAERARVLVVETGPVYRAACRLLAPLVLRGVVEYRDAASRPVLDVVAARTPDIDPAPQPRQRVTAGLIDAMRPVRVAVLLSSARSTLADLAVLRDAGPRRGARGRPPYSFVMQRILSEWIGRND
jgi:hypothetical protein